MFTPFGRNLVARLREPRKRVTRDFKEAESALEVPIQIVKTRQLDRPGANSFQRACYLPRISRVTIQANVRHSFGKSHIEGKSVCFGLDRLDPFPALLTPSFFACIAPCQIWQGRSGQQFSLGLSD